MLTGRSQHSDVLIQSSRRQRRVVALLVCCSGRERRIVVVVVVVIELACFASSHDISAIDGFVMPPGLEQLAKGEEKSTDNAEDDEEDAGSGVCACGSGRPCGGVEGGAVVGGEDHGHGVGHGRHGRHGGHGGG